MNDKEEDNDNIRRMDASLTQIRDNFGARKNAYYLNQENKKKT